MSAHNQQARSNGRTERLNAIKEKTEAELAYGVYVNGTMNDGLMADDVSLSPASWNFSSLSLLFSYHIPPPPLQCHKLCLHLFPFRSSHQLTHATALSLFLELPHPLSAMGREWCVRLDACLPDLLISSLVIASSLDICVTVGVCRRV